jgi:hypothetical protein
MGTGRMCGVKVHHWAYILTLILFVREIFDCVMGFSWNILLLVGAFVTTMILLLGVAALSTHGIGTYRVFFVLYFLLIFGTFITLFVGFILLRTGKTVAQYGYEYGVVDSRSGLGRLVETEQEFWQFYIYFSFAFMIIEILYLFIMFKAYYYDKEMMAERRTRRENPPGSGTLTFSYNQPPANPYPVESAPSYPSAPSYGSAPPPPPYKYPLLKNQTDV